MARRRTTKVLFSDDLLYLRIGDLAPIVPWTRRREHVLTHDGAAAIDVELETREDDAVLTLIHERTSTQVLLRSKLIRGAGRHWYFVGSDGSLGSKLFWLPGEQGSGLGRWDTRLALGLKPRSMYMSRTRDDDRPCCAPCRRSRTSSADQSSVDA
jgi:hypothetical protein